MTTRVAIAVIVFGLVRVAAAQPTDAERYYNEGQTAYDAKRYDDAIAAWDRSYASSHLPGLIYNLAQAHRLRGDCREAVDAYKRFVELDPTSPQRPSAEGFVRDLEPCPTTPPVEHTPPPPAQPPSQPPTPPPPPHVAVAHGHAGERIAGIVLVGVGAAAAGVGGYFGSQAQTLANQVHTACTPSCEWDTVKAKDQEGRSDAQLQYVLYAAGGAAIVSGAVLFALSRRHVDVPVAIAPVQGGAALTWGHAW
jgi:tetratricopeptide (TPR) repeat protein